ncbi:PaaI family thioesterase [Meridianimarinicoccus aquatilis]|uniref:PaaI family thioesterase n=1 Tax=Meridianimarinicoccus aquatilis TaxID=2552766 RepID=A0A4R6B415_9RHOB|nr:PaaI family thioesterase [Fluviibacterium aquatile]TDL91064.1 PaaI family thioesterase [Fluviibacterium aquatile]
MTDNRIATVRDFIIELPYARALRLELRGIGAGWAELAMPYHPDLVGDPATGVVHGGAVSALMDTTCGGAVMAHPDAGLGTATLDLRIDYMRGATPGQAVRARATCVRVTRSIAFVQATAFDDDADAPIATATGAFTVTGGGPAPTLA